MPPSLYGYSACECIAGGSPLITAIETDLRAAGIIKTDLSGLIFQGSYSNATASAGTHSGGGALDLRAPLYGDTALLIMRRRGLWAWHRTTAQGFDLDHAHAIAIGCPHLSPAAKQQETAARNHRNGLANGGPDDGPAVPVQTWQQACGLDTRPTVSLSAYLAARKRDLPAPTGVTSDWANVYLVEKALAAEGMVLIVDGAVGTSTDAAWRSCQAWLKHPVTGIPTLAEMTWLGDRNGFRAVA